MKQALLSAAILCLSFSCDGDNDDTDKKKGRVVATSETLTLVRERNLAELLPKNDHYEASGVALRDGALRVVFDNSTRVAAVDLALSRGTLGPGKDSASQYEGITTAARPAARTFVVSEGSGTRSAIATIDGEGRVVSTELTDLAFAESEKGIEGIAWLDDIERLLVLCEANSCGRGDDSPGHGVIKTLRRDGGAWVTESTLGLPSLADFDDYSDLAVRDEGEGRYQVAVVSQEAGALWVGTLTTKPLAFSAPGLVYGFPKADGRTQYCSLEGVTFIDRSTFALVSDRLKGARGCAKAEAIHVFTIR